MDNLTEEQKAVVFHRREKHARVLAVAGSGKTTTMVHRVKHLLLEERVSKDEICILMFNKLAREQFRQKLEKELPTDSRPEAHSFHSFSYMLIRGMVAKGLMPDRKLWGEDKNYLIHQTVHTSINGLVSQGIVQPDSIDAEKALEAIGLWKGSLIPPDRAGHRESPYLPRVYKEFEQLRHSRNALTFDDLIRDAVEILEDDNPVSRRWRNGCDFVIVDEYQDVNFAQQRLIELIAGHRADVMVVGDDDQTIYEWRGARPKYILHDFEKDFNNKPLIEYHLSHTFRLGPRIAQRAQNVINFNKDRKQKHVIANDTAKRSIIDVVLDVRELVQEITSLLDGGEDPREIIVLGRLYSQLSDLEAQFLTRKIPYHVLGREPFFKRREVTVLLDYIKVALAFDEPISEGLEKLFLTVANTPNRKLTKDLLSAAMKRRRTIRYALMDLAQSSESPFNRTQRETVEDLLAWLERLRERITKEASLQAGDLLLWMVKHLNYLEHFDAYYGKGEEAEDRKRVIISFCTYAKFTKLSPFELVRHIEALDTTQGRPEKQQITMTTIYRVKGREYNYVIIPSCEEGYMPYLREASNKTFDTAGIIADPLPSDVLESERRLFYVAITRAKIGVFIGTLPLNTQANSNTSQPSRFLYEMQFDSTQKAKFKYPINYPSPPSSSSKQQIASQSAFWWKREN
jgi:DNA helicase II / ATP-dependent DNA helicase PcrA